MKRKITVMCENWFYGEIEEIDQEYYNDVLEDKGKEGADNFFRCGEFTDEEVLKGNGKHFLYGWLECLGQSDYCPPRFYLENKPTKYIVEEVLD